MKDSPRDDRPARARGAPLRGAPLALVGMALLLTGCQSALGGTQDGASPSPSGAAPDTAQVLRDLELTRLQALVEADLPTLEELHAADFELVSPPGTALDRGEVLGTIENGELDFLALEPRSDIDVRLYGDGAVLTYRSRISVDVSGTGELDHEARHLVVYERDDADWLVVYEQATSIGGFPP